MRVRLFGSRIDELDEILLDQLHNTKKQRKILKRARKLLGNDPEINKCELYVERKILFLEGMIQDKTLLNKKPKKKKKKDLDILARNPVYEMYRQTLYFTVFGYKMLTDSVTGYMSYFKKDKN